MLDWIFGRLLPAGSLAPDFGLSDEGGRTVRLFGLRGRQLCEIRDDWRAFAAGKVAVCGINGQGIESHGKFSRKHRFPFPLLIDTSWIVSRLYHAGWLTVRRTVYVIDADGRIRFARRGKPSTAEILAAVEGS